MTRTELHTMVSDVKHTSYYVVLGRGARSRWWGNIASLSRIQERHPLLTNHVIPERFFDEGMRP